MDKAALDLEIQEIMSVLDDARLQTLVRKLTDAEIQRYKTELTGAWLLFFEIRYYDHLYNRVDRDDEPDTYFTRLLQLLSEAEKINSPTIYHEERSRCYQDLARLTTLREKKLLYIEKAADEISQALTAEPSSCKLNDRMIDVFLDRARIKDQSHFTDEELTVLLDHFKQVLTQFSEEEWTRLLRHSFVMLDFTSPENRHWPSMFIGELSAAIREFAITNRSVYLEWSKRLQRLISFWLAVTSEEYKSAIVKQLADSLIKYET